MTYRISVDSGGTFTDGVLINDQGEVITTKAHTTPNDLTIGTMNCLSKLASDAGIPLDHMLAHTDTIIHGTTTATNLVVSRNGAKMGTITTKGYKDRMLFLQVAKGDLGGDIKAGVDELFSFKMDPPPPLTRRFLMREVEERVNYKGEVVLPLNEDDVREAVTYLKKQGVEAIAVILFFSHLHPDHEKRINEIIREIFPEAYVALSSNVLQMTGEVGRWSTTMFSAYVGPKTSAYVTQIQKLMKDKGFKGELLFMQSNGGLTSPQSICENPAKLLASGPAAGPLTGLATARPHKFENVVSVDMGGTSFDVCAILEGHVNEAQTKVIEGMKYCLPSIDVSMIGAGGGSIAWIDPGGRLQVGPQSAGALPGPACYGNGGEEPTVTDANIVLGYIDPDYFLGGESSLNKALAEKAVKDKIADPLGLTLPRAAAAIYDIVNAKMAGIINVIFSRRGFDPREFVLCAAGGAGGIHSASIMEELGISGLLIPKVAPVFCAFGMMYADLKHSFTHPYVSETVKADLGIINKIYDEMVQEAREALRKDGVAEKDIRIRKSMDIRYYGQVREQNAPSTDGKITPDTLRATMDEFHEIHRKIVGYSDKNYPTEIIRLHLEGLGQVTAPSLKKIPAGDHDPERALKGSRKAFFRKSHGFMDTTIYDGDKLQAEDILKGPCIVEEKMTTIVVPPDLTVTIDMNGNYMTLK